MIFLLSLFLLLFMPRIILLVFYFIGKFAEVQPWDGALIPVLGFFFMPATTLCYGLCHVYNAGDFSTGWIILMVLSVMFDLAGGTRVSSSSSKT